MRRPAAAWLALAALYGGFLLWYDGGGGRLGDEEVQRYVTLLEQRGADPGRVADLRAFLAADDGGDFVMANFIHFRDQPLAVGEVRRGDSSQQALDRYMAHMYPALFRRACHPLIAGPVVGRALDLWGVEGAADWSLVGLVRYRSRRDMMEIATDPAFADAHLYKEAAMAQTIAIPFQPFLSLGDPRVLGALGLLVLGALLAGLLGRRPDAGRRAAH